MSCKDPRRTGRRSARRGYTLLEMLIVCALLSVVFLAIWSLLRTWSGLYEKGQRRTTEAQLVRSLCDQVTDDLHSVAYVAPPPSRSSRARSGTSRRSTAGGSLALTGGADWLVLDVLQPANPFHETLHAEQPVADETQQTAVAAPELQRIVYTFQAADVDPYDSVTGGGFPAPSPGSELVGDSAGLLDAEEQVEPFYGLLRVAVSREHFDQLSAGDSATERQMRRRGSVRDAAFQIRELVTGGSESDNAFEVTPGESVVPDAYGTAEFDARIEHLPGVLEQDEVAEVSWLEFRYFDGSSWLSSWNSQSQGRLPVAVEMRFELTEIMPADEQAPVGDEAAFSEEESPSPYDEELPLATSQEGLGVDPYADSLEGVTEETPYHRCVVYLDPAREE